jgi:hypothetical protein
MILLIKPHPDPNNYLFCLIVSIIAVRGFFLNMSGYRVKDIDFIYLFGRLLLLDLPVFGGLNCRVDGGGDVERIKSKTKKDAAAARYTKPYQTGIRAATPTPHNGLHPEPAVCPALMKATVYQEPGDLWE